MDDILRQPELRVRILFVCATLHLAGRSSPQGHFLSASDKSSGFHSSLPAETFGAAHEGIGCTWERASVFMAHEFLDVLFGTQTPVGPKDAFGFDGMRRQVT